MKKLEYIDMFTYLYEKAPNELKNIIDSTEFALQNNEWHPEGHTLTHIKYVTNRLYNNFNDINLTLSGLFHDLGKAEVTYWNPKTKNWAAGGHEDISNDIVIEF